MFTKKEDFIGASNIIAFKQLCVRQPQAVLALVGNLIKERDALKEEVADLKSQMKAMRAKLEISDNKDVGEFGGTTMPRTAEIADMGAKGRTEKFGEYGAWDSIFNGASSAQKFTRSN